MCTVLPVSNNLCGMNCPIAQERKKKKKKFFLKQANSVKPTQEPVFLTKQYHKYLRSRSFFVFLSSVYVHVGNENEGHVSCLVWTFPGHHIRKRLCSQNRSLHCECMHANADKELKPASETRISDSTPVSSGTEGCVCVCASV